MVIYLFKKFRICILYRHIAPDQPVQEFFMLLYLCLKPGSFPSLPVITVINMNKSLLFVFFKYTGLYGRPIDAVEGYGLIPLILKAPPLPEDDLVHQVPAPFYHDQEIIMVPVHEVDVRLTKIPPVQNKSCILIAISRCLLQEELQL